MGQHPLIGATQRTQASHPSQDARWRKLLPWHEPKRQAVTYGWWGWFPTIPRNTFGRVCWVIIVGGVSVVFGALVTMLLLGLFSERSTETSAWSTLLGFGLLPAGCLLFAWHLVSGIALARAEDVRLRGLREELAQTNHRVELAKRRLTRTKALGAEHRFARRMRRGRHSRG